MISVKFIANEDFYESMIDPLKIGIKDESDTGELFSRALKLLQLDPRHEKKGNINYILKDENKKNFQEKITENGMKIGQYVQFNIKKLYEQGFIDEDEILRLQQKEYSKNVFDQNYEILRSNEKEITSNDERNRYYSREKFCGGYYLTSQWVEKHWNPFKDWEKKIRTKQPPS